jgi:hypothetical protein
MNQPIHDLVVATLAELGMPTPSDFHQTMLVKDRHFVGHKLRYDGGYAILHETESRHLDTGGDRRRHLARASWSPM